MLVLALTRGQGDKGTRGQGDKGTSSELRWRSESSGEELRWAFDNRRFIRIGLFRLGFDKKPVLKGLLSLKIKIRLQKKLRFQN